jgi:hypothetical protein
MNHYCDIWFWRASDQAAVARHLITDRTRMTGEPDTAACQPPPISLTIYVSHGKADRAPSRGETTRAGGNPGTVKL